MQQKRHEKNGEKGEGRDTLIDSHYRFFTMHKVKATKSILLSMPDVKTVNTCTDT